MSNREWPVSGYVVPLIEIGGLLKKSAKNQFQEIYSVIENDDDAAINWIQNNLEKGIPIPDFFKLTDEDTPGDEMDLGEWYAVWDLNQLYETKETTGLQQIKAAGIEPIKQNWSIYG